MTNASPPVHPNGILSQMNILLLGEPRSENDASIETIQDKLRSLGCENCPCIPLSQVSSENEDYNTLRDNFLKLQGSPFHYIVSDTCHFPFYKIAAFEFLIPVVSYEWLNNLINEKQIPRLLHSPVDAVTLQPMTGIRLYISKEAFTKEEYILYSKIAQSLGAICKDIISAGTTDYIITTGKNDMAIKAVMNFQQGPTRIKFLYPTFIMECFQNRKVPSAEGHIIDVHESTTTNSLKLTQLWEELIKSRVPSKTTQFLKGYHVAVSASMNLNTHMTQFLNDIVELHGGQITELTDPNVSIFITCMHSDPEYEQAKHICRYVGTPFWLIDMCMLGELLAPSGQLLWPPWRATLDESVSCNVTMSEFPGLRRNYIKFLVMALGGMVTEELSKKNNYLICRFDPWDERRHDSKKVQMSKRWGVDTIKICNLQWLEDCYEMGEWRDSSLLQYQDYAYSYSVEGAKTMEEEKTLLSMAPRLSPPVPDAKILSVIEEQSDDKMMSDTEAEEETNIMMTNEQETKEVEEESADLQDLKKNYEYILETNGKEETMTGVGSQLQPISISQSASEDGEVPLTLDKISESHEGQEDAVTTGKNSVSISQSHDSDSRTTISQPSTKDSEVILNKVSDEKSHELPAETQEEQDTITRKRPLRPATMEEDTPKRLKKINDDSILSILDDSVELPLYDMNAICTGCHESINGADQEILRELGIRIYDDIDTVGLNTIVAPKQMRTVKYLKSLSFEPLKYALIPEFIMDQLRVIREARGQNKRKLRREEIMLDLTKYTIPKVDASVLARTQLSSKVFERAGLLRVNLVSDIPAGTALVSSVLKSHGIREVNVVSGTKFTGEDLVRNDDGDGNSLTLLISTRASQVQRFKRAVRDDPSRVTALAVEWDWCVHSIFSLATAISANARGVKWSSSESSPGQ
ncbi:hypothetical protein NCAS_0F00570 [Naumovozyma castellii]|uniref:BRCT domain-containing protein n=1 Tax=Naumovozyma castellii TaxID=27288 RepID=G0VGC1_NAUCA|nr:hypothetical protein NCAS_0F00570 [Naumovozyma castellii CBS 4309]CCC70541.1 hypothetical protein NCAS_0F00570 [Naumovozyma castellii CBS 4309]